MAKNEGGTISMGAMLTLASICLNEEEFIEAWLAYHYRSFDRIVICEGAARDYPREAITDEGLSRDRTADIVRSFPDPEGKINFIQYGWAGPAGSIDDRVFAKMELRNAYAEHIEDGYAFTLDIDEFLHPRHVFELGRLMEESPHSSACAIPQLHLWQNSSQFITGGYADFAHFRLYRWTSGCRYVVNHNWPSSADGKVLTDRGLKLKLQVAAGELTAPAIIHYGFCEWKISMREKNHYYVVRGEEQTRPSTTAFRRAALEGTLPDGCAVHSYQGFLPYVPE
jgi:hypothetical protein